ncbi:MAG: SH3 domain-containing protein [Anaerolineae bacterium]|nr:SH3 domain-containing protein [Anaerolineae bacterium]
MKTRLYLLLSLLLIFIPASAALAQTEVWVTTQYNSVLRAGPGRAFDQLAVVPPAATLHAIGRSADTNWVQVEYEGQRGWIAYWLLIWTGDIISLPVDGINPNPFIRQIGVSGLTIRETRIYARQVTPSDQIGTIPPGERVEVTGRLGGGSFFWLQIRHQGQLYWVGSWDIRVTSGRVSSLLNTSYLFPYGRIASQLDNDVNNVGAALSRIEGTWLRLQSGESVSCTTSLLRARREATDVDLQKEPIFEPLVVALDNAVVSVNTAISAFQDACNRTDSFIDPQEVRTALADIANARRELVIANALLDSLQLRDPLLGYD